MIRKNRPLNIGFVGLGSIGSKHLLNAYTLLGNKAIYHLFDLQFKQQEFEFIPKENINVYSSIEDLSRKKLDLCLICTPNHLHFTHASHFVSVGIPVFIEKPVTINLNHCQKLIEIAQNHIIVGANMRFSDPIRLAKKTIEEKKIGKVFGARAYFGHDLSNWRPGSNYKNNYAVKEEFGGGIIWDGIHELDYIYYLFGETTSIKGNFGNYGILGIETEESADLLLKHKNGINSAIHLDYLQNLKQRGIEIYGSHGTFFWRSIGKNPENMQIGIYNRDKNVYYHNGINEYQNEPFIRQMVAIFKVIIDEVEIEKTDLLTIEVAKEEIKLIQELKNNANEF